MTEIIHHTTMTSRERFQRMYAHRQADRIPIIDYPWNTTLERWRREGMPADANFEDFFGLDKTAFIDADNSPRFESKTLEETDTYRITTTRWGATMRNWTHAQSTPEWLGFIIKDRATWEMAKQRIRPDRDRIDWAYLKANYPRWVREGYWIEADLWFGFDVTHARAVGTERLLMAMAEDPEWVMDIFNHQLETHLTLFQMIYDAGFRFHCVAWPDDMGYKGKQFFSLNMYRELLKPFQQRAIDWAHAHGAVAHLHSCGDINPLVPELVGMGLDALNPLEVKAGMNPVELKKTYGDRLVLHGGINAVLWDKPQAIRAEMERIIPVLKQSGGYIFSSDHSIPDTISLAEFQNIVALAKELGKY